MATRPSQKYGTEDRNVVAGSRPSIHDPRRHPAPTPSVVPMRKLSTVVMPTRPIVHGRLWLITSDTGDGKNVKDRPRSPLKSSCQYRTYWSQRLMSLSRPNSTRSDCTASALSLPWFLEISELTGSPGMARGIRKLRVIAAHRVNR